MNGVYDFKRNSFNCKNEAMRFTGNTVICTAGNLFLNAGEKQKTLLHIDRNCQNDEMLSTLNGQFAIAIMDPARKTLLLIRDQFGIIPFYYAVEKDRILFGTDITSIVQAQERQVSINDEVIHEYFMFRYISGRNTLFKDIFEVKPGFIVEINAAGAPRERPFYTYRYSTELKGTDTSSSDQFEEAFLKSLDAQTRDRDRKEIGILSSGGIDSSILVSCAQRKLSSNYKTFYVGFENYKHNRIDEVNALSKTYNTHHKNVFVSNQEFTKHLSKAIAINEEPLNHPSSAVRAILCEKIEDDVDVLLSGEGADCFYCGYYIYDLMKYLYVQNPVPFLSRAIGGLLPLSLAPRAYRSKLGKIKKALTLKPDEYIIFNDILAQSSWQDISLMLNSRFPDTFAENYTSLFKNYSRKDILNRILYLYQTDYIVEALKTITKIGNKFGIEHRHPFIDVDLINLFNDFPWRERASHFKRKVQIVSLGKKYLPAEYFKKPKEGFGVPLDAWFNDKEGLGRYIQLLSDTKTRQRGIFRIPYLEEIVDNYSRKSLSAESFESIVWPMINFELWCRIFIDNDLKGYE